MFLSVSRYSRFNVSAVAAAAEPAAREEMSDCVEEMSVRDLYGTRRKTQLGRMEDNGEINKWIHAESTHAINSF